MTKTEREAILKEARAEATIVVEELCDARMAEDRQQLKRYVLKLHKEVEALERKVKRLKREMDREDEDEDEEEDA